MRRALGGTQACTGQLAKTSQVLELKEVLTGKLHSNVDSTLVLPLHPLEEGWVVTSDELLGRVLSWVCTRVWCVK